MKKNLIIWFFILLLWQIQTQSQERESVKRILLKDGSEFVGIIEEEKTDSLQFKTNSGLRMMIPRSQVSKIENVTEEIRDGEYYWRDPNSTRLLFAPTARSLRGGNGYFSVYELFFPMIAIGIADVVSVAGGISIFPGAPFQIFYLAPKITPVQMDNLNIACGVLYFNSTKEKFTGAGIFYGVGTYGSEKAALTCGIGWGFAHEVANKPIFLIGGELRLSNSIKLISENWIPPDSEIQILSLGVRFFGRKLAADFALIHPLGSGIEDWPFFPWIGFAYNF